MRSYKVSKDEQVLYFIAHDRDHLMTMLSDVLVTKDYQLIHDVCKIEQLTGVPCVGYEYYRDLIA